jgi:hypothetical protein
MIYERARGGMGGGGREGWMEIRREGMRGVRKTESNKRTNSRKYKKALAAQVSHSDTNNNKNNGIKKALKKVHTKRQTHTNAPFAHSPKQKKFRLAQDLIH